MIRVVKSLDLILRIHESTCYEGITVEIIGFNGSLNGESVDFARSQAVHNLRRAPVFALGFLYERDYKTIVKIFAAKIISHNDSNHVMNVRIEKFKGFETPQIFMHKYLLHA